MSLFLVAQKTDQNIVKGHQYQVGGLIQNTDNVILFDCPGKYSAPEVFGVEKDIVRTTFKSESKTIINNNIV